MPYCQEHGHYEKALQGLCPKCVMDIAKGDKPPPGKTPLGKCDEHGFYYAKYRGTYDGCPVCARRKHG